jgi:Shedu protein SduA, C-terminal
MRPAIDFEKQDGTLVLTYSPRDDDQWVHDKFGRNEALTIKGTFRFEQSDLLPDAGSNEDDDFPTDRPLRFRLGQRAGDYYEINDRILEVGVPILLHKDCEITWKWFTAGRRVSIFDVIAKLRPHRIVVGGPENDAIPETAFLRLVERFPTDHELHRYTLARVAAVVREYTDTKVDAEQLHQKYLEKRLAAQPADITDPFKDAEIRKFRALHDLLARMLKDEETYTESQWQSGILQIIRLLHPRYIQAFERVAIRDLDAGKRREIDILLVDASGNTDILEIKKPFDKSILSEGTYRDNHIPLRELSGSVMQIEKYVYYLNRWGLEGENTLTERYAAELPKDFRINITNPTGMVIIGRDHNLTVAQKRDFEFVKRKYKSIVDIVTYDDLLRRLDFVLQQLTENQ